MYISVHVKTPSLVAAIRASPRGSTASLARLDRRPFGARDRRRSSFGVPVVLGRQSPECRGSSAGPEEAGREATQEVGYGPRLDAHGRFGPRSRLTYAFGGAA